MKQLSVPSHGSSVSRCAATSHVPGKSPVRAVPVAHDGLPLSAGIHACMHPLFCAFFRLFARLGHTFVFCIDKQVDWVLSIGLTILCVA